MAKKKAPKGAKPKKEKEMAEKTKKPKKEKSAKKVEAEVSALTEALEELGVDIGSLEKLNPKKLNLLKKKLGNLVDTKQKEAESAKTEMTQEISKLCKEFHKNLDDACDQEIEFFRFEIDENGKPVFTLELKNGIKIKSAKPKAEDEDDETDEGDDEDGDDDAEEGDDDESEDDEEGDDDESEDDEEGDDDESEDEDEDGDDEE